MNRTRSRPVNPDRLDLPTRDSEMGERIQSFAWSKTALGPIQSWSPALRMMVRFLLANRFPLLLWWGPQYISIYNDAYRPVLGAKHPLALGQPVEECWSEIWHVLQPLIDTPFHGGPATWDEDIFLEINRHGFVEETHFTIAYSPVPDESVPSGIGGVLATVHEITEQVVRARRAAALRDLGVGTTTVKTAEDACLTAARVLADHAKDVPFALLYLIDADGRSARLASSVGVERGGAIGPAAVELANDPGDGVWSGAFAEVLHTQATHVVRDLAERAGAAERPPGPWSDPPGEAAVVPIRSSLPHQLAGLLVTGLSARLRYDEPYASFLELVASQVAISIASARAYEAERQRAEALAELDRAKTAFFSNVSHEFRTPLTLMLGPVDELLERSHTDLPPAATDQLAVVHRNGQRLLRLVNTLLDFSRIEAGRVRAAYQPTDLAAFTSELASSFRSACERAGLGLAIGCEALDEPVFVDREMWEKIALNLLSNAFKFTFEGEIAVGLCRRGDVAELRVRDTGTGIPSAEIPRLFERFHRVENARARTHEGSGIGLALVQELVRLHGGTVTAESVVGEGTTFVVRVPFGSAHLPADQIAGADAPRASVETTTTPFVEEALRWLPDFPRDEGRPDEPGASEAGAADERPRVLVVDDNTDMRQYLTRLLSARYAVEQAADGAAALASARARPPALVLSDVMMPGLDGFGLLRELRGDPRTSHVPVVMLSARAGEESRIEGVQAGADDYLTKPFTARELLARVDAQIDMARFRAEANAAIRLRGEQLETLIDRAPLGMILIDGDLRIRAVNPVALPVFGERAGGVVGRDVDEIIHQLWNQRDADEFVEMLHRTLATGIPRVVAERAVYRIDRDVTECYESRVDRIPQPDGRHGLVCYFRDISAQVTARRKLAESEEKYRALFDSIDEGFCIGEMIRGADGRAIDMRILEVNRSFERQSGFTDVIGKSMRELALPVEPSWLELYDRVLRTGEPERFEREIRALARWFDVFVARVGGEGGTRIAVVFSEITARKRTEEQLRDADRRKDEFLATLAHELRNPLAPLRNGLAVMKLARLDRESIERTRAMMERQLGHMVRLVDDLLDLSRISGGKIELRKERIDLGGVLQQAIETGRPAIDEAHHDLTIALPRRPIAVDADPTRLAQVFSNLLSNAAKFTERGGRIRLEVEPDKDHVLVSVADNGIGIPEHKLGEVFEMFTQIDPSLERSQSGLGIGLAIVKRLVAMHGGTIEARSAGPGKGSRFTVRLPIAASVEEPECAGAEEAPQAPRRRILVADDNRDAAVSLSMILELLGNEVRTAGDGEEAVQVADAFRPDLIVLDIGMPKLSGYEACQQIRQLAWGRDAVLVALTGWGQEEDRRRSQDSGFDFHLVKPIDPAEIERLIAGVAARRRD